MTDRSISAKQFRDDLGKAKKPSKYRNEPVVIDGIRFDSKREGAYYVDLKMLERAGEVTAVELQRPFQLCGPSGILIATYKADFVFWDNRTSKVRVIDVKGFETKEFRLKRKMMRAILGIEIEVVK